MATVAQKAQEPNYRPSRSAEGISDDDKIRWGGKKVQMMKMEPVICLVSTVFRVIFVWTLILPSAALPP